jgi:hypothetical protein
MPDMRDDRALNPQTQPHLKLEAYLFAMPCVTQVEGVIEDLVDAQASDAGELPADLAADLAGDLGLVAVVVLLLESAVVAARHGGSNRY